MAKKPTQMDETGSKSSEVSDDRANLMNDGSENKMLDESQGKSRPGSRESGEEAPSVRDLPPANPTGEPVKPVEAYPNISEAGKQAAALGVETAETKDVDGYVGGETIVEHPLAPTDANPDPHGIRGGKSPVEFIRDGSQPGDPVAADDANTEVEGTSDNAVHLGDGRTLGKGEKAKVTKEVAADLRARKVVK